MAESDLIFNIYFLIDRLNTKDANRNGKNWRKTTTRSRVCSTRRPRWSRPAPMAKKKTPKKKIPPILTSTTRQEKIRSPEEKRNLFLKIFSTVLSQTFLSSLSCLRMPVITHHPIMKEKKKTDNDSHSSNQLIFIGIKLQSCS